MNKLLFIFFSAFVASFAQTPPQSGPPPKLQDQMYYLDSSGRDWVFLEANPDRPLLAQFFGKKHQIPSPVNMGVVTGICPFGSKLWACVIEEPPSGDRMVVLCWDLAGPEKRWERVGEVEIGHGVPSMMVPLRQEGLFLGVTFGAGFVGEERSGASLVAKFQFLDGKFRFKECVEMTLEGIGNIAKQIPNPKLPVGSAPESQKNEEPTQPWQSTSCKIDPLILTPSLQRPSISPDHLALAAAQPGIIWIFELDKGQLRRTYNLEGFKKEELKKVGLLNFSILGTAFDLNGRLIVAKRDSELARIALRVSREPSGPEDLMQQKSDFQMFTDLYKDIRWVALDPETGTRQELDSSTDYPTSTLSFKKQTVFRFLVTPFGQVRTNAYQDWEFLKRDIGISLETPKMSGSVVVKKAISEEKINTQKSPSKETNKPAK